MTLNNAAQINAQVEKFHDTARRKRVEAFADEYRLAQRHAEAHGVELVKQVSSAPDGEHMLVSASATDSPVVVTADIPLSAIADGSYRKGQVGALVQRAISRVELVALLEESLARD
ncbi:hypothetical protein [Pseudoclavibacter soli]|uniref:hypothetical protein n=1 Tax=Pseudoclavibacter soli TaxID=452623 RepID=UPI0003FC8A9A|nr:hypothetical protein [Pseudoclavibacter soli]